MTITINQISAGKGLCVEGQIYLVVEYSHVKPGKGSAFVRVKLRNLKTDLIIERTFKSSDKLEDVFLDERPLQYLYQVGSELHFMDQNSFEEIIVFQDVLGNDLKYLQDNLDVTAYVYEGKVQKIILPNFIETQVIETEPGIRGDSARSGTKFAKITTGADIQVPLFINNEEWIKVDIRSGTYVERVKK
jgi:elongation factor P